MKKYLGYFSSLLLIVMFSACSNERPDMDKNEGMVDFSFRTSIPSGIQTYASNDGGASNVDAANYDLRYIMEVWTKETPRRLAYRDTKIVDDNFITTSVTFEARLLAMDYDAVFWADFVPQGTTADLYYNTNDPAVDMPGATKDQIATNCKGLTAIAMKNVTYEISQDARDAYYTVEELDLTTGNYTNATQITLKRPFGKYRLIATDAVDGYLTNSVVKAKIQYKNATTFPAGFNALTKEVNTSVTIDASALLTSNVSKENAVVGSVTHPDVYILAYDYIFAAPAHSVSFEAKAYSDDAATIQIGHRDISNIPIVENKLTTIIGNFFTNEGKLTVIISDPFETEIKVDLNAKIKITGQTESYTTVQDALAAAILLGGNRTIEVPAGFYDLGTGISIPAGITVKGEGKETTVFRVKKATSGQTSIDLFGVLEDVWVMYDPQRVPGTAWNNENPTGVNMRTGSTLTNSRVTGHRNGVYANNVSGYTIDGCDIWQNRTGFQAANGTSGTVSNNSFKDNETIGALLIYLTDATITAVPTFTNNTFSGNWASDFENRWATAYVVDLNNGNTFSNGTKTLSIAPNSGEGSSLVNITKEGTAFKANIVTAVESNVTITGATQQSMIFIGSTPYATLGDAIAAVPAGGTITLLAGGYDFKSAEINKNITIVGEPGTKIISNTPAEQVTSVYYGKNPVFFVTAGNLTLKNITISTSATPQHVGVDGITLTGGTLTLDNVTFDGIYGVGGFTGVQHGRCITAYGSSEITVTNCTFKNYNKNGIHMTDNSKLTVSDCTFIGHGDTASGNSVAAQNGIVIMNSSISGTITNCTFSNFAHQSGASSGIVFFGGTSANVPVTGESFYNCDNEIAVES